MDYIKVRNYRHADPLKVRQVWDALSTLKPQRSTILVDKVNKILRRSLNLKDDQIRLLLDEIVGDGLMEKLEPPFGKSGLVRYILPDFTKHCPRAKHDWYCFQCHRPGEILRCSDCFRVYHADCVQEASILSSPRKSMRSPTAHDNHENNFTCPVCESRPKCEFSRKQIRKLLEFATHHLRKQPLWKTFLQIGYKGEIIKNEYIVYKYTDLELLQRKIKDGRYVALEEFSMDVQLLVHDVCILYGPYSNEADEIRFFLRSVNSELNEIQLCTDCYINAKARVTDWISKPCKPRHELIWARNRTPASVGLFGDTPIAQYYWPAKILLERDDGFEIRFFGGSHERMFAKKIHTRPFHLPADEVGVLRRSSSTASVSGGGFERAWNEVSKLQANIDSGYYTHSSGESDLPPSDDDYSDEIYLGPRRKVSSNFHRPQRPDSPRSSLASGSNKRIKRRRRTSSSSRLSNTSITPVADSPSSGPSPGRVSGKQSRTYYPKMNSHLDTISNDKKQLNNRLLMSAIQPGTPGAAAMSALAETKAAMAAAVGAGRRSTNSYATNFSVLTESGKQLETRYNDARPVRGQRSRGRPPLRDVKARSMRQVKYHSSSSSHRSSEDASSLVSSNSPTAIGGGGGGGGGAYNANTNGVNQHNWRSSSSPDWKVKKKPEPARRGRPAKSRGRSKTVTNTERSLWCTSNAISSDDDISQIWPKFGLSASAKISPTRVHSKSVPSVKHNAPKANDKLTKKRPATSGKNITASDPISKKSKRHGKKIQGSNRHDDDDELTDRCISPLSNEIHESQRQSSNHRSHLRQSSQVLQSTQLSSRRVNTKQTEFCGVKFSPSKSNLKHRSSHSSNYSTFSSSSSSTDMDDDSSMPRRQQVTGINKVDDEEHGFRSPTRQSNNKTQRTPGASSTMLRRPPFAPPLNVSNSSGSGCASDRNSQSLLANSFHGHSGLSASSNLSGLNTSVNDGGPQSANKSSGSANASSSTNLAASNATGSSSSNIPNAPGMSTVPRSHLPPNKRAAAAATAAALNKDTSSGLNDISTSDSSQQRQMSLRSPEQSAGSPKKQMHKGVQTPSYMDTSSTASQQPCVQCKEFEAERLITASETKKALRDLEERLVAQFKEEKAAALHAALEQAQSSAREAIEHERKLAHDALQATEVRFNELVVQTKRRQWCRNCLSEAIYHCCWNTSYCSTQCQQEHWQKEHKRQCRRKR